MAAIFEEVCERVFGRTFALHPGTSPILNTLNFSAAMPFSGSLTFFMPPLTRGPLLAHLGTLALPPSLLRQCLLCPLHIPGPLSPGGASEIHTGSGRLSTAPRHLRPYEALSTGSGASRRRPPSAAASGASSLQAALRWPAGGRPRVAVSPQAPDCDQRWGECVGGGPGRLWRAGGAEQPSQLGRLWKRLHFALNLFDLGPGSQAVARGPACPRVREVRGGGGL